MLSLLRLLLFVRRRLYDVLGANLALLEKLRNDIYCLLILCLSEQVGRIKDCIDDTFVFAVEVEAGLHRLDLLFEQTESVRVTHL